MLKIVPAGFIFILFMGCSPNKSMLLKFEDAEYRSGYVNNKGDTIIPPGKYQMCISDTISEIGFVLDHNIGFIGIDKTGKFLFRVFNYDNGPDYPSEGLFRIVKDGKIGYANLHGKVVIEPQYKCAWPFENGYAKVSYNCNIVRDGELDLWKDGEWFYIDKTGRVKK
jgi:hypothetical protein